MRQQIVYALALGLASAQRLSLGGDGAAVSSDGAALSLRAPNGALLTLTDSASLAAEVKVVVTRSFTSNRISFSPPEARVIVRNVPSTCTTAAVTTPCAPSTLEAPFYPKLFYCRWAAAATGGGSGGTPAISGPVHANATDIVRLGVIVGTLVDVTCPLPPLPSLLAAAAASVPKSGGEFDARLTLVHYAPLAASETLEADGVPLAYAGLADGNRLTFDVGPEFAVTSVSASGDGVVEGSQVRGKAGITVTVTVEEGGHLPEESELLLYAGEPGAEPHLPIDGVRLLSATSFSFTAPSLTPLGAPVRVFVALGGGAVADVVTFERTEAVTLYVVDTAAAYSLFLPAGLRITVLAVGGGGAGGRAYRTGGNSNSGGGGGGGWALARFEVPAGGVNLTASVGRAGAVNNADDGLSDGCAGHRDETDGQAGTATTVVVSGAGLPSPIQISGGGGGGGRCGGAGSNYHSDTQYCYGGGVGGAGGVGSVSGGDGLSSAVVSLALQGGEGGKGSVNPESANTGHAGAEGALDGQTYRAPGSGGGGVGASGGASTLAGGAGHALSFSGGGGGGGSDGQTGGNGGTGYTDGGVGEGNGRAQGQGGAPGGCKTLNGQSLCGGEGGESGKGHCVSGDMECNDRANGGGGGGLFGGGGGGGGDSCAAGGGGGGQGGLILML